MLSAGELVRLCCLKLISLGVLFKGQSTAKFDKIESFETSFVSQIEEGDKLNTKVTMDILKQFDLNATEEDCMLVREACSAVSTRAARLSAAGILALVKKMNREKGTLYQLLVCLVFPANLAGQKYLNEYKFVPQVVHDRDTYATSNISP